MTKNRKNKIIGGVVAVLLLLVVLVIGCSFYMLDYSLDYPLQDRKSAEAQRNRIRKECPWTVAWMDSVYLHHAVKDTFVVMPSGYKAHAIYLYAPKPTTNTAVVVHGYKVRAEGMLHIAYLYNHNMGYNVLLPDLYGHGESEGDHIQMGWNDRWDVIRWSEVADEIFSKKNSLHQTKQNEPHTQQVLHGISMGAATVMAVSGEKTPDYVKCFVEDCGYTSVWDEFAAQLKDQFGLPSFPLMNTTSQLCRWKYGWSFAEAQQIEQVKKSTKPMLFIHGDKDDFVPYRMLQPLYAAKTKGKKNIFVAKGSIHAMAYRDHHQEYTEKVKRFVEKYGLNEQPNDASINVDVMNHVGFRKLWSKNGIIVKLIPIDNSSCTFEVNIANQVDTLDYYLSAETPHQSIPKIGFGKDFVFFLTGSSSYRYITVSYLDKRTSKVVTHDYATSREGASDIDGAIFFKEGNCYFYDLETGKLQGMHSPMIGFREAVLFDRDSILIIGRESQTKKYRKRDFSIKCPLLPTKL